MHTSMMKPLHLMALAMAAVTLAACGTSTVSRHVAADGSGAESIVFPDAQEARPRGGTFPNLDNLRQVQEGLTKSQIQNLIGPPQFHEGVFGVREWDYLFNIRAHGDVTACQYKVLFDKNGKSRSIYWSPVSCPDLLQPPRDASVAMEKPIGDERRVTLSTDALFAFDKSGLRDITDGGRADLDKLASELRSVGIRNVLVLGYADRLGHRDYNLRLSQRRADTVREYLVEQGLPQAAVHAKGRGSVESTTHCSAAKGRQLVACLAPDRRVEIRVNARQPE